MTCVSGRKPRSVVTASSLTVRSLVKNRLPLWRNASRRSAAASGMPPASRRATLSSARLADSGSCDPRPKRPISRSGGAGGRGGPARCAGRAPGDPRTGLRSRRRRRAPRTSARCRAPRCAAARRARRARPRSRSGCRRGGRRSAARACRRRTGRPCAGPRPGPGARPRAARRARRGTRRCQSRRRAAMRPAGRDRAPPPRLEPYPSRGPGGYAAPPWRTGSAGYGTSATWHDARGLQDSAGPEALFEPEPSLESGVTKRRFRNLVDASGLLGHLTPIAPFAAGDDALARVHDRAYVEEMRAASAAYGGDAGDWTPFGRGTFDIAALAAGGCIAAVDAVLDGTVRNAYALVRPPGHHAGPDGGCGYCIFSNVALAALHLREARGLDRIAIVDWDVHHGNGTQATFWRDSAVLAISLHQADLFPVGSGRVEDVGEGDGIGTTINVPLPAGAGRAAYLAAFDRVVRPALERFAPDFLLVASGLDASMIDPLGRMNLSSECFAVLTDRVLAAADLCGGRLVLCHE